MKFDETFLVRLVHARMPFGRFKNRYLTEIPVFYLEWLNRNGFPKGELGQFLSTMHEIKINGLENIIQPIIRNERGKKY
jgi:uncharacterized protein